MGPSADDLALIDLVSDVRWTLAWMSLLCQLHPTTRAPVFVYIARSADKHSSRTLPAESNGCSLLRRTARLPILLLRALQAGRWDSVG